MRFSSCVFVGAALLSAGLVAFVSWNQCGHFGDHSVGPATPTIVQVAAADEVALHRLHAKADVVRRLIDGELTLLEAAAWFHYINEATSAAGADFQADDASWSEGEHYCRQVIRWARWSADRTDPYHGEKFALRLEKQLDTLLRHNGAVTLPTVQE